MENICWYKKERRIIGWRRWCDALLDFVLTAVVGGTPTEALVKKQPFKIDTIFGEIIFLTTKKRDE